MAKVLIDRELLEHMRNFTVMHDSGVAGVLRGQIDAILANPAQQGEAVEVVGWRRLDRTYELTSYPSVCAIWHGVGYPVQALYTHPAASVPAGCKAVPVELLEQIAVELEHDNDRYLLGRGVRALLDSAERG